MPALVVAVVNCHEIYLTKVHDLMDTFALRVREINLCNEEAYKYTNTAMFRERCPERRKCMLCGKILYDDDDGS